MEPEQLLKYLGAYVNRVAISPQRVTAYDPATGLVTYTWATNAAPDVTCTATIPAIDFLTRFAQHILPPGFQRIRFRGLWCTAHRATKLRVAQRVVRDPPTNHVTGVIAARAAGAATRRRSVPLLHLRARSLAPRARNVETANNG